MWIIFWYQTFVTVFGKLGEKLQVVDDVLLSHEQEIYPTTSLDEISREFDFQSDRKKYVDLIQVFLVSKLQFVNGPSYETYNTEEVKKSKKEAKADEKMTAEE